MCYTCDVGRKAGEGWTLKRGFSLLELLVVIAIISILAAIAVPNFLDAQFKTRIAKVHADLADLSKAIEAYFIEYRVYPAADHSRDSLGGKGANLGLVDASDLFLNLPTFRHRRDDSHTLAQLTTPVAYINAYPFDPFATANSATYSYSTPDEFTLGDTITQRGWIAWSVGPGGGDNVDNGNGYSGPVPLNNVEVAGRTRVAEEFYNPKSYVPSNVLKTASYDPTNGTRSPGIISRFKQ
jgi:prepilin-type N-terminal cleavage/methylation domain-containing protein